MTRGRDSNVLHIVADDLDEAREQFIDALQRDRADRGLQAATSDAQVSVAGLAAQGPVKVVNDERARLVEAIAHAEREAARWQHAAGLLSAQAQTHANEEASGRAALAKAEAHLTAVRDDAVWPLLAQATADGQAYLDTHRQQDAAWDATRSTNRLGRRAARRRLDAAQAETHDAHETTVDRWGSVPDTSRWAATTRDGLEAWAARVAHQRTEAQPAVASARQDVARTDEALKQTRRRHRAEAEELTVGVYGRRDAASRPNSQRSPPRPSSSATMAAERRRGARRPRPHRIPPNRTSRAIHRNKPGTSNAGRGHATTTARGARRELPTEHGSQHTDPELGLGI